MLLIAALALQTLLVLSVIDGFGYKEFNPGFRYGSDPVRLWMQREIRFPLPGDLLLLQNCAIIIMPCRLSGIS